MDIGVGSVYGFEPNHSWLAVSASMNGFTESQGKRMPKKRRSRDNSKRQKRRCVRGGVLKTDVFEKIIRSNVPSSFLVVAIGPHLFSGDSVIPKTLHVASDVDPYQSAFNHAFWN